MVHEPPQPLGKALLKLVQPVQQLLQKETLAVLSVVLAVLALCFWFYCLDSEDIRHSTQWSALRWVKTRCTLGSVGVAYRGNCRMDTSRVRTTHIDFSECLGTPLVGDEPLMAVRQIWLQSPAGQCATKGDQDYAAATLLEEAGPPAADGSVGGSVLVAEALLQQQQQAPPPPPPPDTPAAESSGLTGAGLDAAAARLVDPGADAGEVPRRLAGGLGGIPLPQHREDYCQDSFLTWAALQLANATEGAAAQRCAYRYGASELSITSDWEQALADLARLRALPPGQEIPCWQLGVDDCVLSFSPLSAIAEAERSALRLAAQLALWLGVAAVATGALAARLHYQDGGCCCGAGLPPGGYHSALPTREPGSDEGPMGPVLPLSERVVGIVRAAASRLRDNTPLASGENTQRCVRTVEVGAGSKAMPPRNLAADFLDRGPPWRAHQQPEEAGWGCW